MLKAIIIEDELGSVNVILQLLAEYGKDQIQVVGVADAIQSGLELIQKKKPDVVFMDIELRDGSSFQILENLEKIDFKLIFITAFDKFALDAFRFSAMDYLLKPIDNKLFQEAINKVIDKTLPIHSQKQFDFLKEIREHNVVEKIDKLALIEQNEILFESLANIIYLMASESYTIIHTASGKKYTMSKNLGHYQELLSSQPNFFRIHYSTMVNIDHIHKIAKNESNRQYKIELQNGQIFEVSQRRVSEFKKIFDSRK
jgi:two-component system LytT family response regulator